MDDTNLPHDNVPPETIEIVHVCDANGDHVFSNNHYYYGRTVEKFIYYVGGHIDKALVKTAERLGYGPRVTTLRIRRRVGLIKHSFAHVRRLSSKDCRECIRQHEFLHSHALINREVDKLQNDIKRLLKYVNSGARGAQKQAIDCILELSIDYSMARALMIDGGAVGLIEHVEDFYSRFRTAKLHVDKLLLSSSRKVLVSLRDSHLSTLLSEWKNTKFPRFIIKGLGTEKQMCRIIELWNRIAPFLADPNVAFLILRVLNRTPWHESKEAFRFNVIRSIVSRRVNFFETDECMSIIGTICQDVNADPTYAVDAVTMFLASCSESVDSQLSRRLSIGFSGGNDIFRMLRLKAAVMRAVNEDDERVGNLQPLHAIFESPFEQAVCEFVWSHWDVKEYYRPTAKEGASEYCRIVAPYVDSANSDERKKAWEYVNYFLNRDHDWCEHMLEALSQTTFAASVDFFAFKRRCRAEYLPSKGDSWEWTTIYRHSDDRGRICLADSCLCGNDKKQRLEYPHDERWVSTVDVERGTAVCTAGHHPLIAGHGTTGVYYVAKIHVGLECDCFGPFGTLYVAVTEGTKPEDVCIDLECPHDKLLFVPEDLRLVVLTYPSLGSPVIFVEHENAVEGQLALTWTPASRTECRPKQHSVKVTTVVEAVKGRILFDEFGAGWEREAAAICATDWRMQSLSDDRVAGHLQSPIYAEIARYVDSTDAKVQERAWKYVNYSLAYNRPTCDVVLEVLASTAFAAVEDFVAFKRTSRAKSAPCKDDEGWDSLYRHVHEDGRTCLRGTCSCRSAKTEELVYHRDWVSWIPVDDGTSISHALAGRYPLIAGYSKSGIRSCVVETRDYLGRCKGCRRCLFIDWYTIPENLRTDDFIVEVRCCQQAKVFVPKKMKVLALRCPPEKYPEVFYEGGEGADATGPFSWKPVEIREFDEPDESDDMESGSYTVRAMSKKEAIERGLISDDEANPDDSRAVDDEDASGQEAMVEDIDDDPDGAEARTPEQDDDASISLTYVTASMKTHDEQPMSDDSSTSDGSYEGAVDFVRNEEVASRNSSDDEGRSPEEREHTESPTEIVCASEIICDEALCVDDANSNDARNLFADTERDRTPVPANEGTDSGEMVQDLPDEENAEACACDEPPEPSTAVEPPTITDREPYMVASDFRLASIILFSMGLGVVLDRAYNSA